MQQILDFKALKVQKEAIQMHQERQRQLMEEKKIKESFKRRMKRNEKLKQQLQKWDHDKQEKQERYAGFLVYE